ncbi:MAG: choice-of-anchor Q domain-containing protein, partial [Paludibacteraceae bacterium]
MKKFILSIGLLLGAMSLSAGVVYVAPNAVGDSTGSSWDNAMENIQMAINKAKEDETGQTVVWLKAGTYNVTKAIAVKDSVSIYGSFAGTEATADDRAKVAGGKPWEYANPTILNGGDSVNIMNVGKATLLQPVEINGVVFEHGFANSANKNLSTAGGGAIRLNDNAALVNCVIRECKSDKDGGGVRFYGGGSLYYCLFENCYQFTGGNGGGAINASVTNSGSHIITIEGCEFRGCHSEVRGGVIATNASAGKILINACTFYNNYAMKVDTLKPGAVIYDNAGNITEVTNCVFYNNTGNNCMYLKPGKFNNNTVAFNIGTVYVAAAKNAEVCNNVNWANVTDATGATATGITSAPGLTVLGLNNYTYNPIPDGWTVSQDAAVANTNVEFASNKSNGDFEVAEGAEAPEGKCLVGPHFVQVPSFFGAIPTTTAEADKAVFLAELEAADFHIKRQSALLNAGTDSAYVESDRDGNNRPQGPRVDVGAYELAYHMVVIPAYSAEEGRIADENATTLNDTT